MRTTALLLIGLAVGWVASGVEWNRDAYGQEPVEGEVLRRQRDGVLRRRGLLPSRETPIPANAEEAPPFVVEPMPSTPPVPGANNAASLVGRYQVSAYGTSNGHGCYIVDTMTGKTWHTTNGQRPEIVASGLNSQPTPEPELLSPPTYSEPPAREAD